MLIDCLLSTMVNHTSLLSSDSLHLLVVLLEKMLDSHVVQQEPWGMVEPCLQRINKSKSVLVLNCPDCF